MHKRGRHTCLREDQGEHGVRAGAGVIHARRGRDTIGVALAHQRLDGAEVGDLVHGQACRSQRRTDSRTRRRTIHIRARGRVLAAAQVDPLRVDQQVPNLFVVDLQVAVDR